MHAEARLPYEHSLLSREPLRMHCEDGRSTLWEVERWLAPADPADATALDRAEGPALDVGCGPGRIVAALAERGVLALGIDVAETAVRMTRDRGLNTLRRDVFTAVPGEGRWASVLLLDGNIGIGGDPARLLARVRQLLRPTGSLIVEAHHDDDVDEQLIVRFTSTGQLLGPPFEWAHVGLRALARHARAAGYSLAETWRVDARVFARFVPEPVLAAG